MNWISRIVGVSRRTVHKIVTAKRIRMKHYFDMSIGFDNRRKGTATKSRRFRFEVKIVNQANKVLGLKGLILRTKAFISGYLDSAGSITEDEPP